MALKYLLGIHLLASVIWVGGMFFAFQILRPSAAAMEPQARLKLWAGVFQRFFPWVWVSVLALLVSGYWMVLAYFGGMKNLGMYIHLMMGIGTLMAIRVTRPRSMNSRIMARPRRGRPGAVRHGPSGRRSGPPPSRRAGSAARRG